jgi:hypothetical protein
LEFVATQQLIPGRLMPMQPTTHRPVLERYKMRNDYVNRIRTAAREPERDGFLWPDDAAIIIRTAGGPAMARIAAMNRPRRLARS